MPSILNVCRKGSPTFLCAFLILPLFTPLICPAAAVPNKMPDTIGRKSDAHYKREKKDWNQGQGEVQAEYLDLIREISGLEAEKKTSGNDSILTRHIIVKKERIRRLKAVINNLNALVADSAVYVIKTLADTLQVGGTYYNKDTREIEFWIKPKIPYSFVHETTHGNQFINGEFVFDKETGLSIGDDIDDEVEAYKNQFSYQITSLPNFTFSSNDQFSLIDSAWLLSLKDTKGITVYSDTPKANYPAIGRYKVTVDSDITALKRAYPLQKEWPDTLYPLKDRTYYFFRNRPPLIEQSSHALPSTPSSPRRSRSPIHQYQKSAYARLK